MLFYKKENDGYPRKPQAPVGHKKLYSFKQEIIL